MGQPVDLTRGQYNLTSCNEQLRQLASAKKAYRRIKKTGKSGTSKNSINYGAQ